MQAHTALLKCLFGTESYSGRARDNDNDIRNAYGAPITMPSSPLVMPESPLVMHCDAQNGQCKLYTIYTVINVCSLDDGLIPPCGYISSHKSHRNAVSQELHLPGMDIWEHVLLVQISA